MRRLIKVVVSSILIRDVTYVMIRQFGVKLLSFVALTYSLKVMGPTEVGLAGLAIGVVGVIGFITQLGLDTILPQRLSLQNDLKSKNYEAARLYEMRFSLVLLLSPILVVGIVYQVVMSNVGIFKILSIWGSAFCLVFANAINPQSYVQGMGVVRVYSNMQLLVSVGLAAATLFLSVVSPSIDGLTYLQALSLLVVACCVYKKYDLIHLIKARRVDVCALLGYAKNAWPVISTGFAIYFIGGVELAILPLAADVDQVGVYNGGASIGSGVNAFLGLVTFVLYPRILRWNGVGVALACGRVQLISVSMLVLSPIFYFSMAGVSDKYASLFMGASFAGIGSVIVACISQFISYVGWYCIFSFFNINNNSKLPLMISTSWAFFSIPAYIYASSHFGAIGLAFAKASIYYGLLITAIFFILRMGRRIVINDIRRPLSSGVG